MNILHREISSSNAFGDFISRLTLKSSPSNAEFLQTVFGNLAPDEAAWVTTFAVPPGNAGDREWAGKPVRDLKSVADFAVNAYFSVAGLRGDRPKRQKAFFCRMPCVVLDDAPLDDQASWVLETSAGNYQVGYILKPAITDEKVATRLQSAFGAQGLVRADTSGYSAVRYARLPVGANSKTSPPTPHKLTVWNPSTTFTLDDLALRYGLDLDHIRHGNRDASGQPDRAIDERRFTNDDGEYVRSIVTGDGYHDSILALSSRYVSRGMSEAAVIQTVRGLMDAAQVKDDRWQARYAEVARSVSGAVQKFGKDHTEPDCHPLARFHPIIGKPAPARFTLPGFIGMGVTVLSGAHGIGKTSVILPMSMIAAGLIQGELTPTHWRHVVYVTEDVQQAERIIAGVCQDQGIDVQTVAQRLHLVEAVRLEAQTVARVGATYREMFTRTVNGADAQVEVLPLVVFDTKSAVFALENENDSAQASELIARIKQDFADLPVWVVGHVAKGSGKSEQQISTRGSSAIEADANQTVFIIQEGDRRLIVLGKTRFEPKWSTLEIASHSCETAGFNEWGEMEPILLRWGIPTPSSIGRKDAQAQAAADKAKREDTEMRTAILDAVDIAWRSDKPIGRVGVRSTIPKKAADVARVIDTLLAEMWLYEVEVPTAMRTHPNRRFFLIRLSPPERDALVTSGELPARKLEVPPSWRKSSISSVPDLSAENDEAQDSDW
jgi:hypothetical protein